MAIRDDITIDWLLSPRIIEIASPVESITVQDIYDTVRSIAPKAEGMGEPEIIDAGGKETLSQVEKVVLTVTLYNAKIKFEARESWTVCEIAGGNIVALNTEGVDMNPIEPSPYVNVDRAKSTSGTLVQSEQITEIRNSIDFINAVEGGGWEQQGTQWVIYDSDNVTEVARFDTYDAEGNLTGDPKKIVKRVRV